MIAGSPNIAPNFSVTGYIRTENPVRGYEPDRPATVAI
jgi:hypothetical protein